MVYFGIQNINRTFLCTSKPINMLGSTLFVGCLLLNTMFLLFFTVDLLLHQRHLSSSIFDSKNKNCTCFQLSNHCWPFLFLFFEVFKRLIETGKMKMLHFRKTWRFKTSALRSYLFPCVWIYFFYRFLAF